MALLKEINQTGRTMIIVTHEQSVADQCSRIIYMRDGLVL